MKDTEKTGTSGTRLCGLPCSFPSCTRIRSRWFTVFLLGVLLSYLYERFGFAEGSDAHAHCAEYGSTGVYRSGILQLACGRSPQNVPDCDCLRVYLFCNVCEMIRQTVGEKKEDHSEKKEDSTNMFL